jgi:membrane protein
VLVLALALARTFGGADLAKQQLDKQLHAWMAEMEQTVDAQVEGVSASAEAAQAQDEVTQAFSFQVREIADQLYNQVNTISFGTLGGIGLVMLIWSVVGTLGKVEDSFNQVWGVKKPRALVRKVADYLFVIMILPFLITAVSSVPVANMVANMMDKTVGGSVSMQFKVVVGSGLLKAAITLTIGTLTFAFLLGFMPNARVKVGPALAGGLVTLLLFAGWLKLCAMLQVGIAKYSALYGGFAVLPILLMWVYTSWQIILLGSEIAFAAQNRDTYMLEQYASEASLRARLLLALALCAEMARLARTEAGGPFDVEAFGHERGIPRRFLKEVIDCLTRHQLLAEVAERPGEYLLCRCGSSITVGEIVKTLLDDGESPDALGLDGLGDPVTAFSQKLDAAVDSALGTPVALD